jgi:predicted amidohydrolase YtcJ
MEKKTHSHDKSQHSGLSRRGLLKGSGALVAAGGIAGVTELAEAKKPDAGGQDLAFVNGKIHTMDGSNRIVSQLSISNGRFDNVGDGIGGGGGNKKVINLRGKTVIPGLIDSHTHIVLVGNRPGYHVLLEDLFSIPDVIARYQQVSRNVPEGNNFITTIGPVAAMQFPEQRLPNLTELDAVNRPVYIQAAQGGARTNSLGKAWLNARGVTNIAADGTVGGGATGTTGALLALRNEQLTDESRMRTSLGALQYYAALGLTTHLDQGAFQSDTPSGSIANENNFTMYNSFLALNRQGLLPARLRTNFLYMDQDPNSLALSERLKNAFQFFGDDMMKTGSIGEFVAPDPTAPISLSGSGFPPVANTANNTRWLYAAMKVAQAGWRAEVHSLSATDFQAEIDGYGLVNQQFPITDLRWVVAHVPLITLDYINKLKALGGGLKVGWGPTRTGTKVGPPYRTILNSGINVGYHADGGDITVINPWLNFYTIITGKNLRGDLINEGQTLTRQETMFLATAANKWFIGEDDLGSIEVGNHADLVVLDRDYFFVADAEIPNIRSLLTVVGGNVSYDAGVL